MFNFGLAHVTWIARGRWWVSFAACACAGVMHEQSGGEPWPAFAARLACNAHRTPGEVMRRMSA